MSLFLKFLFVAVLAFWPAQVSSVVHCVVFVCAFRKMSTVPWFVLKG